MARIDELPTLGVHRVTARVLKGLQAQHIQSLRGLAARYGVQKADLDEVVNAAYLRLYELQITGGIADVLRQWCDSDGQRARLQKALLALWALYVRYEVRSYHRSRTRWWKRERTGLHKSETASPNASVRSILVELLPGADIDGLLDGKAAARAGVLDQLFSCAHLTDRESEFLKFRIDNPSALDAAFDQGIKPYEVSRLKQRTKARLWHFVMTGEPLDAKGEDQED